MTKIPSDESRRRSRPNFLAAPPITGGQSAFEGLEILTEFHGPNGVLLAGALRDVMLWLETAPADRSATFGSQALEERLSLVESAQVDEVLRRPLLVLTQLGGSDTDSFLLACQAIALWADQQRAPATRLAFAQASALLAPQDPKLALAAGRLARDCGDMPRAESWFRYAIRRARHRDHDTYGWAYIGLGIMFLRTGNYPAAHTVLVRAVRHAERNRLPEIAAGAHHDLFHAATEMNRIREAYTHARAALEHYGKNKTPLRRLAYDVGRFWVHQKAFRRALPVLEAAAIGVPDPNERGMISAIIAYAAAETGEWATYKDALRNVEEWRARANGGLRLAETFLFLAWAHLAAHDWVRAIDVASKSATLAEAQGETENRRLAEEALAFARAHAPRGDPADGEGENPALSRQAEQLAREVLQALSA